MILTLGWLLAVLLPLAFAGVEITNPGTGNTLQAGDVFTIAWRDSGDEPALDSLTSYQLFLCAGGNDDETYTTVQTLVPSADFSDKQEISSKIDNDSGESVENAYFIKMVSSFPGGFEVSFSDRFSISGMTGQFPPEVMIEDGANGLKLQNIVRRADAAPAAGDAKDHQVPYSMQTGPIRYAPMRGNPPSKITAESMKPLFPTSSVKIATTHLPVPSDIQETISLLNPMDVVSVENTLPAAAQPSDDDMQKFLNRWKD